MNPKLSATLPLLVSAVLLAGGLFSGTAEAKRGGGDYYKDRETAKVEEKVETTAYEVAALSDTLPPLQGPKRVIAVGKFDAVGSFKAHYGDWAVGDGIAAMLATALNRSNRFLVVERANLNQVLSEQDLKASGAVNPETGPGFGQLAGAHLLVYGAVTEFGPSDQGGGVSFGLLGGSVGSPFNLGLGQQSSSGTIAMDIRLVDTTTGEIVTSFTIKERISASGWNVSGGYKGLSLGTNQFEKTPLGEAVRRGVNRSVGLIALAARDTVWSGRVVAFDGRQTFINAGERSGIRVGDRLAVAREVNRLTDPTTGELLFVERETLGYLTITRVAGKISFGAYQPASPFTPERGDLVVFAGSLY